MTEQQLHLIEFVVGLGLAILLPLLGLIVGRILENRHFKSIREREAQTGHFPAVPTKTWDQAMPVAEAKLVSSSVVVSLDYFKRILANFRNIFGGNVRSYETLLDRAKREAILRLKEQVPDHHIIVNLRLQTSNIISVHDKNQQMGGVEVLAFGTAVKYAAQPHQPA